MAAEGERAARRLDLDWVRIGAFALLILYHVAMFYVPWSWHVKSPRPQAWLEPAMVGLHPWRLTLLFLVSGAATRFMADRASAGRLALQRTGRLLPPLLLGMLVIVPPQTWLQVAELAHRPPEPFAGFWLKYVTASGGWRFEGAPLITPTWNHLWFVAYLLVYTLGLMAVRAAAPRALEAMRRAGERGLSGWGVLVWPTLGFIGLRMTLAPRFPETHALFGDWSLHAVSLSAFLFGYLLARSEGVWAAIVRGRWIALGAALLGWGALAWGQIAWPGEVLPAAGVRRVLRAAYGVEQWGAIVAVLGFARLHLAARDGPVRRYLTEAIFPFYIVHQTATVAAAYALAPLALPLPVEAALLVAATAAACGVTFEIVRRVVWLRPLFGLKPAPPSPRRAPPRIGLGAARDHAVGG